MPDDRSFIFESEERYAAAINASDVDEIDDLFAEDAILRLPDRPVVSGRETIVTHQREFFRSVKAASNRSLLKSRSWNRSSAYGCVQLSNGSEDGSEVVTMRGKYINLYKRDEMKHRRVWRSINNIDHPHHD